MRETSRWSTRVKNYDTHETIVYILSLFGKPMFVWYGARLPFNGHTFSNVCANTTISQISFESIQHSYIFDYFLLFISSTLEVYYLDFIHFSSQMQTILWLHRKLASYSEAWTCYNDTTIFHFSKHNKFITFVHISYQFFRAKFRSLDFII